jgi:hypothetical protein
MEPVSSPPRSQQPVPCPYTEIVNPVHTILFIEDPFNMTIPLALRLPTGLFLSDFPTITYYASPLSHTRARCISHLPLLGFISQIICEEQ